MLVLALFSLLLLLLAAKSSGNKWNMILFGTLHLVLSLGYLVMLFAFYMDRAMLVLVLTIYLLPVLTMCRIYC